ncbi:MAG: hypothetical protein LBH98_10605 [Chitinispirillales bacterium]|jgi:hypothetical protein|nr:hypothetical protein [Chitinispirillales bacterium]
MTKILNDTLLNGTIIVFSVIFAFFFIACSKSHKDTGNNDDEDEIDGIIAKLPELPEATGGMLTEERYDKMPNKEVTEENLHEFIAAFRAAKDYERLFSVPRGEGGKKGIFKRLEREKSTRARAGDFEYGGFTIPDGQGDSIIWEWTYKWTETENAEFYELIEMGTERYQAFDYSQSGILFLGQVVCLSFYEYWYEDEKEWKEIKAGKVNGEILFRGEFTGGVEYMDPYYKETRSSDVYERRYGGEIVINSGTNRIKLSIDDWWDFLYLL